MTKILVKVVKKGLIFLYAIFLSGNGFARFHCFFLCNAIFVRLCFGFGLIFVFILRSGKNPKKNSVRFG